MDNNEAGSHAAPTVTHPRQDGEGSHLLEPCDSFQMSPASSHKEGAREGGGIGGQRNIDEDENLIPSNPLMLNVSLRPTQLDQGLRIQETLVDQARDAGGLRRPEDEPDLDSGPCPSQGNRPPHEIDRYNPREQVELVRVYQRDPDDLEPQDEWSGTRGCTTAFHEEQAVAETSEEIRSGKRERNQEETVSKPPTEERKPIPLPPDLSNLPDQSYHLAEDLQIIIAVRACINEDAPSCVPYRPEMVEHRVAEMRNSGIFHVDEFPNRDGQGSGHGTAFYTDIRRWRTVVTNPTDTWIPNEMRWVAKVYGIGDYIDKKDACRAADMLKLKMNLCGSVKRETFNFPPENYMAEMAKTDVQFIRHHSFYCEHVLSVKRQVEVRHREEAQRPYRGVFRQKVAALSRYRFVSRLLLRSQRGTWWIAGTSDSATEAAMAYDRLLISEGLFVNPGARHHIPNFPLRLYRRQIMAFLEEAVPHLQSSRPEALDRLEKCFPH